MPILPSLFIKRNAADMPVDSKAPATGLLVTNHLNLMYMISAGMVMPPKGFGGKHFKDCLEYYPGWVPLFIKKPYQSVIDDAIAEAPYLMPCIAEVSLKGLSGQVATHRGGLVNEIDFLTATDSSVDRVILVPAPLPASRIRRVLFQSVQEKEQVLEKSKDYNNVSFAGIRLGTKRPLFKGVKGRDLPSGSSLEALDPPLSFAQAAGGIGAMLLHTGNRGDLSAKACTMAFEPHGNSAPRITDPILSGLASWLRNGRSEDRPVQQMDADSRSQMPRWLFWGAVDRLVQSQCPRKQSADDAILDYVTEVAKGLEGRARRQMVQLRKDLETVSSLGNAGPTELFERHLRPFSRSLILFFLRDDCGEFLQFKHRLLSEVDHLCAAVLFGASFGWQKIPAELRNLPNLAASVSDRMAASAHRLGRTGLSLGELADRCRPLRELFDPGPGWNARQERAAAALAKDCGWNCVRTTIRLGRGSYEMRVVGSALEVSWYGWSKNVKTAVSREAFLELLAQEPVSLRNETRVRKLLGA